MIFDRTELANLFREGRELTESLMIDACRVERATGEQVTDPVTGEVTDEVVMVYEGKCKVQWKDMQDSTAVAAGHVFTSEPGRVDLPKSVVVAPNDTLTVTEALDLVTGFPDTSRVGQSVRLVALNRGTLRSANRWDVELMTG